MQNPLFQTNFLIKNNSVFNKSIFLIYPEVFQVFNFFNRNFWWIGRRSPLQFSKKQTPFCTPFENVQKVSYYSQCSHWQFPSKIPISSWRTSVEEFFYTVISGYRTGNLPTRWFWRWVSLTLYFAISWNVHTHFKNLAANAARFLMCVCPFYDIAKG